MKMSSFFSGLSRSLSEDVKAYTNSHPGLRRSWLGASNTDTMEHGDPKLEPVRTHPVELDRIQSLPTHLQPADSVSDISESGSPTAASVDSPTAATTAAAAAQQRKKQYKIHGMDAYDYWSLIKSL